MVLRMIQLYNYKLPPPLKRLGSSLGDDSPLIRCYVKILSTCSLSGVTKMWEMPQVTDKIAVLKDHKERATDVVFSPVDDCLATASADRFAKLWKTVGTLLQTFKGHLNRLSRVAFHPSGTYLGTTTLHVSSSLSGVTKLWEMPQVTNKIAVLKDPKGRATDLVFSPMDDSLATASADRTAKLSTY
ncbi:PREDICTED: U4/U6 small nuclear ribonucleoprotein PRP4-like protein isoform X2 [Camelina sativa]|uniref:U4/U6 small nuclear ribonucleoprotein PRP4-like protein isoform X2 n=1 Tax=Camelina sativa TaxID=90675 RepID=A0ABM0YU80_CAMSA|nr:PREDICTED: U4/U6 small nuclear ribonucleoprotein PRP4-like protein isoform X2 [Camelina sativa]